MKRIQKRFLYISFGFFILFLGFTYLVKKNYLDKLDIDLMVKIQNLIPEEYDFFLSFFSLIGSFEITSISLFILCLTIKKLTSFLTFIPFLGAHLIEVLGKIFLDHPGPPSIFHRYRIFFSFPSSLVQPGNAYPSGHSLRTIFIVFLITFIVLKSKIDKLVKLVLIGCLLIFTLIMLVSRVSLGEHWVSDVIGGVLLGLSSYFFSIVLLIQTPILKKN